MKIHEPWIDFLAEEEDLEHATVEAYAWGCRCERCLPFKDGKPPHRHDPSYLVTGKNGRPYHPKARHGTVNGFNNYKCRCNPCRTASAVSGRRRRQKNKERKS